MGVSECKWTCVLASLLVLHVRMPGEQAILSLKNQACLAGLTDCNIICSSTPVHGAPVQQSYYMWMPAIVCAMAMASCWCDLLEQPCG
eukprot:1157223-Pelagomonas_calceolata.AAC.3